MYNNPAATVGGGALASTGIGVMTSVWLGLAAFALVALGTAVMRIVPRGHRS
ncbi:hypothetical protein ACWER6_17895 [Streptomyces sp. NPDC004009]|uniref:hypothetical protein n=1 Tax=unclassified Streptomyces TaxID=2593676 RepID=UPI0033C7AC8D